MNTARVENPPGGFAGVLAHFSPEMLDESACRRLIIGAMHGERAACPTCAALVTADRLAKWHAGARIRCRSCGRSMSATSGTVLDNLHASFAEVVLFLALASFGLGNQQIADIFRRDRTTINAWRKRLQPGREAARPA